MPKITCPNCGNRGLTDIGSEDFEPRGQWERKPVRKCKRCGIGMTVHFSLLGPKAKLIDHATWQRMEETWVKEFGAEPESMPSGGTVGDGRRGEGGLHHFHVYEYASGGHPRRTVGIFPDRAAAETYAEEYLADWEDIEIRGDATTGFSFTSKASNFQADLGALRVEACSVAGCTTDV
jgi:hypothetical protein